MRDAARQAEQSGPGGDPGAGPPRGYATRRRLVVAFSFVLASFTLATLVQGLALRRMESSFVAMAEHDEQMQLALQLESEVRAQYGHGAALVGGDAAGLAAYERARARAVELGQELGRRLDEPETLRWLAQIQAASDELDHIHRGALGGEPLDRDQLAAAARLKSDPLVSLIEQDVDLTFAHLQALNSRSREELVELEGTALRLLGALLVVIAVFVIAAVGYLSRSVARPLARLSVGAAAVAGGDLEHQIDIATPDEFGALAAEFNGMTASLRQHQQRLVEAEKLAAVGRLAAGVAHELNNPLQVMLGYLSLNRGLANRRLAEQLGAAEAEAQRCKLIVEGLLALARPAVRPDAVDLRALCEDVAAGLRVTLPPGGLTLAMDGAARALGDPPKIRQILFNLMKNAAEAAGPAGQVEVRLRSRGDQVEVAVADDGPGIPPASRGRLFEPFYSTKPTGTGLGLAVSRALAQAHGGDIDVGDGAPAGAVFTLRLRRAPERSR